jgi:hypothetical protein
VLVQIIDALGSIDADKTYGFAKSIKKAVSNISGYPSLS